MKRVSVSLGHSSSLALASAFLFATACGPFGAPGPEDSSEESAASVADSSSSDWAADTSSTTPESGETSDAGSLNSETSDAGSLGAPPTPDAASGEPVASARCQADGVSGSPTTLLEAVDFINALPRPLTVPCFIEALDRPLYAYATWSFVSAQPAVGRANPRFFFQIGALTLSVVPSGDGRDLVEFAEATENFRSYKAELAFPIVDELQPETLYKTMQRPTGSVCALCHSGEVIAEHEILGLTFESLAYRPNHDYDVSLDEARAEHASCDPELEPERCAIYSSIFDFGAVEYRDFPVDMPVFF